MPRKIIRLLDYAKHLALCLLLWPAAAILRRVKPAYRGLWLVSERGNDARDNGYWFFRYLRTQHKEQNACYVIDPSSPDHSRVKDLGQTVKRSSLRHYLMYMAADYLVGSHVQPASPELMVFYHLRQLQHRHGDCPLAFFKAPLRPALYTRTHQLVSAGADDVQRFGPAFPAAFGLTAPAFDQRAFA